MIQGVVIHGDGIGRKLGYPTANLDIHPEKTKLHEGVYAATAHLHGKKYQAALVVHHSVEKVEVHLIDYAGGDFYGDTISVEPLQQISRMEPIEFEHEMKQKIKKDIEIIREVFSDFLTPYDKDDHQKTA